MWAKFTQTKLDRTLHKATTVFTPPAHCNTTMTDTEGGADHTFDTNELLVTIKADLEKQSNHILNLKAALEKWSTMPHLFNQKDLEFLRNKLMARATEYHNVQTKTEEAYKLYVTMLQDYERRVNEKEQVLGETDVELGILSREPDLAEYFALDLAQLKQGLEEAKESLLSMLRDIGPGKM